MGTFITFVSASIQFALATFGAYMSLRRPTSTPHFGWFVVFVVLGISGIVVTVLQASHAASVQEQLNANIAENPRKTAAELARIVPTGTLQAPWRLSKEQIDLLAKRMRPFASDDDRHGWLKANTGNRDSISMAQDLVEAFRMAGWKMEDPGFESESNWFPGVAVGIHEGRDDPFGMSVFRQTMKEFGLDNNLYIRKEVVAGRFEIHVGLKP